MSMAKPDDVLDKATPQPRRLALVTGASSGLGESFARAYAARGFDVALVARRLDRLELLADDLRRTHNITALAIAADLSDPGAPATIFAAIGRDVDVLVNNAGFSVPRDYALTEWSEQQAFIAVLVTSVAALTHAVLPGMVARRYGRIIQVSSLAALSPGGAGHTLYPAAKSFVLKLTQSLSEEVRGTGVNITAVCPGFVKTGFHAANGTADLIEQAPRLFWQTPEVVVADTIAANEAGRVVVVPGLHNKLVALAFRLIPDGLGRALIRRGGAKYRME
jgi:uncharacterized protein